MKIFFLFGMLAILMMGCYSMPGDGDFSVVPSTNNPDYTGGRGSSAPSMPSIPGGF